MKRGDSGDPFRSRPIDWIHYAPIHKSALGSSTGSSTALGNALPRTIGNGNVRATQCLQAEDRQKGTNDQAPGPQLRPSDRGAARTVYPSRPVRAGADVTQRGCGRESEIMRPHLSLCAPWVYPSADVCGRQKPLLFEINEGGNKYIKKNRDFASARVRSELKSLCMCHLGADVRVGR